MVRKIKPVSRIDEIEAEINKIVGEVFSWRKKPLVLEDSWVPYVDISEKKDQVVVEVELPGISPRDITVLLDSNRIEIKGLRRRRHPPKRVKYMQLEREYGPFYRCVFLPEVVVPEKAIAELENGVLTIALKKHSKEKGKKVVLEISKPEA
jgi:HSP20 family protein